VGPTTVVDRRKRKKKKKMNKKGRKAIPILVMLTLMLSVGVSSALATDFSATFDINGGSFSATYKSTDTSTWHPGVVGEQTTFTAVGGFSGSMTATTGNYGSTYSTINAVAKAGGADLRFSDSQDFDILSANWNTHIDGYFFARAAGSDAQTTMNLKSVGTMYVWSEATNLGTPELRGGVIEKGVKTWKSDVLQADLYIGLTSSAGDAKTINSAAWGFGTYAGATGTSSTSYNGGTRTLSASGSGTYLQTGYGLEYLDFNGFVMGGGGSMTQSGSFAGGFTGTYSMTGN